MSIQVYNLSVFNAMDIIDVHGPDETFWPPEHLSALKRLIANSEEFRDYVEDAKWFDSLFDEWEESEDGASFDWDDVNFDQEAPPPSLDDDRDGEDEGGVSGSGAGGAQPILEESEGEPEPVIELDPDDVKDMDEMLTTFIHQQMENADPTEFRVFSRDFDEMVDIAVPDQVSLDAIDQAVAKSTGPLQKDLRRMIAARTQAKRIPGMRSGRLHAPNLHRIMSGDDRVFSRREEAPTLDTAISLLLDCSGSMSGTRMKLAAEAAYAIGSVLSRLGVSFECLGFTDRYNDPRLANKAFMKEVEAADEIAKIIRVAPLQMPRFKTFEDRWTQPVQRRFAHVYNQHGHDSSCGINMGMTPEGCSLEFAGRRLLARKEKRKIMISMTDGTPGGHVFNPRGMEDYHAYARQSEQMVKSITASGIDLIGVGIQHDGVTGYYPNSMVINSLEDMPKQLLGLLKRFIVG